MKSSTFKLSNAQKTIFAIVLAMAFVISGCEAPTINDNSDVLGPANQQIKSELAGTWHALDQNSEALLRMSNSSGHYQVMAQDGSLITVIQFEYEISEDESTLHIQIVYHFENGKTQPAGSDQDLGYNLSDNTLRIFGRSFQRQ